MSINNGVGANTEARSDELEIVRRALVGLKYGSVEIVVHDARIVQVERKEKVRLIREGLQNGGRHV
jgi:hypothetical protein